ncbi:hypothetical protein FEM48_Zijuj04G0094700 [Ziziphus jujuba var. spinosa]|uniref:DUF4283 domain-containing protein n=1 Tax=Ziziphus jujuba var. spinosa TaxID=714518 RepID=A0A978VJ34_ZIZJJ|nr:hypothetical protein FEM48_Zijuj04G0094700 [Ziziphus jujuba var. spinosa]
MYRKIKMKKPKEAMATNSHSSNEPLTMAGTVGLERLACELETVVVCIFCSSKLKPESATTSFKLHLLPGEELKLELVADEANGKCVSQLKLVGRIMLKKVIQKHIVQAIIRRVWFTNEAVKVELLHLNTFLFCFQSTADQHQIWRKRPWSIDGAHLVLREWRPDLAFHQINFSLSTFWIQIHGLPPQFMTKENAIRIGSLFHEVLQSEHKSRTNIIGLQYMRIQVEVDIFKPLLTSFFHKCGSGGAWIQFAYERVESASLDPANSRSEDRDDTEFTQKNSDLVGHHEEMRQSRTVHSSEHADLNFKFEHTTVTLPVQLAEEQEGTDNVFQEAQFPKPTLFILGVSKNPEPSLPGPTITDTKNIGKRKREGRLSIISTHLSKKRPGSNFQDQKDIEYEIPHPEPHLQPTEVRQGEQALFYSQPSTFTARVGSIPASPKLRLTDLA